MSDSDSSQAHKEIKPIAGDVVYFTSPTDRPKRSHSLGKIAAALARAQGQIINAEKTRASMYGAYSTLAATWDAIRKPLSENEIAVYQRPLVMGEKQYMATMLIHSSGEFIDDSILEMKSESNGRMNAMQALGSAVTYSRRYTLQAAIGIAPEDDDAQGAGNPGQGNQDDGNSDRKGKAKPTTGSKKDSPIKTGDQSTEKQEQKPPPKPQPFDILKGLAAKRGVSEDALKAVFADGYQSKKVTAEQFAEMKTILETEGTTDETLAHFVALKQAERSQAKPATKPKGIVIQIGHPDYDGVALDDMVPEGLKLLAAYLEARQKENDVGVKLRNSMFQLHSDVLAELKARGVK